MMKISTLKKRMRLRRCLKWVCFWVGLSVKTRRVQSLIITVPVSETSVRKDPGSVVVDVVVVAPGGIPVGVKPKVVLRFVQANNEKLDKL